MVAYATAAMEATTTGGRDWSGRRSWAGLAVTLAFLGAGLVTLPDRGLTWDEPESVYAGVRNLENLRVLATGAGEIEWPWHELLGYQYAVDTVRILFARAAGPLVGGPELAGVPIRGVHLFHLLLATASLLLVYRIAMELSGSVRVGVLSALVLAVTPKFLAHSQSNPKDLPALFAYALFLWALDRALAGSERVGRVRLGAFAAAGAALGFAFASHVLSALLAPMAVAWVAHRLPAHRGWRRRDLLRGLATMGAVAGAVTFALWPWLWAEPLVRSARVVRRVLTFSLDVEVLYLGRLYPHADPPFHYFTVLLVVATPAVVLAAVLGGIAGLRRAAPRGHRRLALLAVLWAGIPMGVEAFTGARYDGVRHLLVVLPGLALLAGIGLDRLCNALAASSAPRRRIAQVASILAGAAFLWLGLDLVRYHPYQDAYLNAPTRGVLALLDLPPEEVFELEYWGNTYKEGAEWLNAHARDGAVIHVPLARWCAEPYLEPDLFLEGPRWDLEPSGEDDRAPPPGHEGPEYLMFMTRESLLAPELEAYRRDHQPVHTVERLGATLLEIYRSSP